MSRTLASKTLPLSYTCCTLMPYSHGLRRGHLGARGHHLHLGDQLDGALDDLGRDVQ